MSHPQSVFQRLLNAQHPSTVPEARVYLTEDVLKTLRGFTSQVELVEEEVRETFLMFGIGVGENLVKKLDWLDNQIVDNGLMNTSLKFSITWEFFLLLQEEVLNTYNKKINTSHDGTALSKLYNLITLVLERLSEFCINTD